MKCTLPANINECPFFTVESCECKRDTKCSFQETEQVLKTNSYVRKERWYEKYYKKNKNQ